MGIRELIDVSSINTNVKASNRDEVLRGIADLAKGSETLNHYRNLVRF